MNNFTAVITSTALKLNHNYGSLPPGKKVNLSALGADFYFYDLLGLDHAELGVLRSEIVALATTDMFFSFAFVSCRRKIDAVFFDMDATLIKEESIVELAKEAGSYDLVNDITEKAMAGTLDFEKALRQRVLTLKGLSEEVCSRVFQRLTVQPGAKELISFLRELGVNSYLVSGGFNRLAKPLATNLGIEDYRANSLTVENGCLTGELKGALIGGPEKKQFLSEVCNQNGFDSGSCIAVGDGANDIAMLFAAGIACGFSPKPVLIDKIDVLNRTGSHVFLIDYINLIRES